MHIDAKKLVYQVGNNVEEVRGVLLEKYGEAPTSGGIQKWITRRSMPGIWAFALLQLARDKDPSAYLVDRTKRISACEELSLAELVGEETSKPNTASSGSGLALFE